MNKPGSDWVKIVSEPDAKLFAAVFTVDVRLDLSVARESLIGADSLRRYFNASRGMFQRFAFTHEMSHGSRTVLEWEGEHAGRAIAGATILVRSADSLIANVQIYHRPYEQQTAFAAELSRRLESDA